MASARVVSLVALAGIAAASSGVRDPRPSQTSFADDGADLIGWTPRPTNMPTYAELKKRGDLPNATCGYISGESYDPWTCYNGNFCGVRNDWGVFGCCTSYYPVGNDYSLTGCTFFTACVPYNGLSNCDSNCQSSSRVLKCSDTQYPYCMEYAYTDAAFKILDCNMYSDVVIDMAVTPASGSASSTGTTSNQGQQGIISSISGTVSDGGQAASSSVTSSHSSSTSSPTPTPVPSPTPIGPIVGGVVGGAAVLLGAAALFWFIRRSKKNGKPEAAATGMTEANKSADRGPSPAGKAPETFVNPSSQDAAAPPYYAAAPVPTKQGPPSPSLSNVSHGQTPFSPVSSMGGFQKSPHLAASEVHGRSSLLPPGSSHGDTLTNPSNMSPHLSASEVHGQSVHGDTTSPSPHLSPQEIDGRSSMPPQQIHEAPAVPMSFRSAPSSNWSGPFHEMPG